MCHRKISISSIVRTTLLLYSLSFITVQWKNLHFRRKISFVFAYAIHSFEHGTQDSPFLCSYLVSFCALLSGWSCIYTQVHSLICTWHSRWSVFILTSIHCFAHGIHDIVHICLFPFTTLHTELLTQKFCISSHVHLLLSTLVIGRGGTRSAVKLTCELSCSEDSLKVVVIFFAKFLASAKPKEKRLISAISV